MIGILMTWLFNINMGSKSGLKSIEEASKTIGDLVIIDYSKPSLLEKETSSEYAQKDSQAYQQKQAPIYTRK